MIEIRKQRMANEIAIDSKKEKETESLSDLVHLMGVEQNESPVAADAGGEEMELAKPYHMFAPCLLPVTHSQ